MKRVLLSAVLGAASLFAGCANMGATEPVLGNGNDNGYRPMLAANQIASPEKSESFAANQPAWERNESFAANQPARETSVRGSRELAALRADLDALLEEQKRLTARIIGLEQDNLRKDEQIKELQSLMAEMDKRSAEVDKNWQARMSKLSETMDKEREARRRELDVITSEIDRKNAQVQPPPSVEMKEIVVVAGDTLSSIAKSLKISVAELKRINNLKDDRIYIGQKLKFPAN